MFAVIVLSLRIVNVVGNRPKKTVVAVRKPVPVRVAFPPPIMEPLVGAMLVRVGGGMYWYKAPLLTLAAVETFTEIAPAGSAGATAVIRLSEITVTDVAGTVPKSTALVVNSPAPLMVTTVPPASGPKAGLIEVMTAGDWNVYESVLLLPPGVVIVTGTVPTGWAGAVTVTRVSPVTVIAPCAGVVPNRTLDVPVRPVPVMATEVPPAITPAVGKIVVGKGGAK